MSDLLTATDLEIAKKHDTFHSEVITGKAGGVAGGEQIATATNAVTGQVQKTLPEVLNNIAPYYFGDFPNIGGQAVTLTNSTQCLVWQLADGGDGHYYAWSGAFPNVVAAGSSPTPLGAGGWVDRSDLMLRSDINIVQKRYACVADMVADTSLVVGKIIETIGYHSGWDATTSKPVGGNRYEIVVAGTGVDDGGSFINLSNGLQAKGLFVDGVISVCQFGAKADGVTDSTLAINNALSFKKIAYCPIGHYITTDTLYLKDKTLYGDDRSSNAISATGGVLIEFKGSSIETPMVNVGGHYGLSGIALVRSGAGTRGIIINYADNAERCSYIRNVLLYGASHCVYSNGKYVYSNIFENIEFGNYSISGLSLYCVGATGNVYNNLYSSDWLAYPTVKNSAETFISLTGSHSEGVMSQINCEHVNITKSCFIFNGCEALTINSVHVEGVEFSENAKIFNILDGGNGSSVDISGVCAVFNKMLGNQVSLISVTSLSSSLVKVKINGVVTRDNDINGTSNHRFAIRGGTLHTTTPTIDATNIQSDLWFGNNFLPIEQTTYKPILERFNSEVFYSVVGGVINMPKQSTWPMSSGVYPANSVVMNSAIDSASARGWHVYGRGDFSKPQHGTIGVVQYSSAMTPDATAYAAFAIGDYIEVGSVAYKITNKYGGSTFTVSPTTGLATGSYPCLTAAPQYRVIN